MKTIQRNTEHCERDGVFVSECCPCLLVRLFVRQCSIISYLSVVCRQIYCLHSDAYLIAILILICELISHPHPAPLPDPFTFCRLCFINELALQKYPSSLLLGSLSIFITMLHYFAFGKLYHKHSGLSFLAKVRSFVYTVHCFNLLQCSDNNEHYLCVSEFLLSAPNYKY